MNALEQQLAALLTQAPGEPPKAIDPDVLLAEAPQRRRYLAPVLAAAVVVGVAVSVAVFATRGGSTSGPAGSPTSDVAVPEAKAAALHNLNDLLDQVSLPPGAQRLDPGPNWLPVPDHGTSPNELDVARFFTVPGTCCIALNYVGAHLPEGMKEDSGGSSSDGTHDVESVTYVSPDKTYLSYSVADYHGDEVVMRVDAQTTWVAGRPDWSYVPADATSVDITIVRAALNPDHPEFGGAPTVQRTLTGEALTRLADALNALAAQPPEGVHSCPAILVDSRDLAVFHTPTGDIRMMRNGGGCSFNATITAPPNTDDVYVNGADFTGAVLTALGLPRNYGFGH